MRVLARIRRLQFLQLQLVGSLRHPLARFKTSDNSHFVPVSTLDHYVATLELFTRQQDVDNVLPFVFENRLGGNHDELSRRAGIESDVRLHTDSKAAVRVLDFERDRCYPGFLVDSSSDIHDASHELDTGVSSGFEYRLSHLEN